MTNVRVFVWCISMCRCRSLQCGTLNFAANNTIQFFNERGATCKHSTAMTDYTNCVSKFVTPKAAQVAQWYYDCESVQGIELENTDTSSCYVHASHLEVRIMPDEVSLHSSLGIK